jgi:hypothetical protein
MDVAEVTFPSFQTGLNELCIVDAVLESARRNTWVDVAYPAGGAPQYL